MVGAIRFEFTRKSKIEPTADTVKQWKTVATLMLYHVIPVEGNPICMACVGVRVPISGWPANRQLSWSANTGFRRTRFLGPSWASHALAIQCVPMKQVRIKSTFERGEQR
jgi:hypothetical protein